MKNELAFTDLYQIGSALAKSGYFTDAKDENQAIAKVLAGQELGIGPVASMTGLYLVKGKVTLSANVMAGLIKASSKYNYKISDHTKELCSIEFFENGQPVGFSDFTIDDAEIAGLLNNDAWKKYPKNMLFSRALTNGCKWHCPDITIMPVYTQEELGSDNTKPDFVVETLEPNLKIENKGLIDMIKIETNPERQKEMMSKHSEELGYIGDMNMASITKWLAEH